MMQQMSTQATATKSLSLVQGAVVGFVATIPMTLFMLLMHRLLPKWQKYALPPEAITHELSERVDLAKHMDKPLLLGATVVSHFAYGTVMGMIYSVTAQRLPLPAILKGILFGVGVWVGSYLGLLPALNISQSGDKEPWRRILLMIGAHIIWGASTSVGVKFIAPYSLSSLPHDDGTSSSQ